MGNSVSKKFGSRILSDEEVKLTLPTYDKLLEQIDDMRKEEWDEDKSKKLHNQKINNISILGARGTGKTSILKSLINKLEEENKEDVILGKNIVLPMIVPENMSTSSNLMSMILGLFKGIVDELEAKEESKSKECWFSKESDISKRYRELVRKFCFLQPDFKSVPIKQYTTENDYVEKSSQIFQADIEFMSYFNDFIDMLIETKEEKNERLIFVFIDDMDLSTQRCVDAVRSLLAYISHPRIVTVLAGDLETFEEALTLDFIRQEQMVREDIFKIKFVAASGEKDEYLERKKTLTYEYLKKVMPVIYRHNLREWSLETRGNYIVKGNVGNAKSFVELLNDCFSTLENPPIFQYFENEDGEGKNLPQMFHIFDHTARGLNAVYNVLLETIDIMKNGEEDKKFPQIKILLETIVGSNSLFNKYRKVIFDDIIKFGNDFNDTRIDCENLKSFIIKEFTLNTKLNDAMKDAISLDSIDNIDTYLAVRIFGFFALIDFSIRVLEKSEILVDETYKELKRFNVINLINNPKISDKMLRSKNNQSITAGGDIKRDGTIVVGEFDIVSIVITKLLFRMDFGYTLTLFQFLSKNGKDFIFDGKEKIEHLEWSYSKLANIYDMVKSIRRLRARVKLSGKIVGEYNVLAYLILEFGVEFRKIQEFLSGGQEVYRTLRILLSNFLGEILSSLVTRRELYFSWNRTLFFNTLAKKMDNKIFNNNFLIPLSEKKEEYEKIFAEVQITKNRILTIIAIDKHNLWKDEQSNNVCSYIERELDKFFNRIDFYAMEHVDISCFKEGWNKFKLSYRGGSTTNANKLYNFILKLLDENKDYDINIDDFIDLIDNITKLAYSKAWYGRERAFEMLKELQDACFVGDIEIRKDDNSDDKKYNDTKEGRKYDEEKEFTPKLFAFIHMYLRYKLNEKESLYWLGKEISEFNNDIFDSSKVSVRNQIKTFRNLLATEVGEEVVSKFEELFPSKGEKNVK